MANEIELKDFAGNTLVEIALGVRDANRTLHDDHGGQYSNAPYRLHSNMGDDSHLPGISFDVAVTASEGSAGHAGAKISVAQVLGIGGSVKEMQKDT